MFTLDLKFFPASIDNGQGIDSCISSVVHINTTCTLIVLGWPITSSEY